MLTRYRDPQHNIILATDAYKLSHFMQYPANTAFVQSYVTPRVSEDTEVVSIGADALWEMIRGEVVTREKIDEAGDVITGMGLPFNREGWELILSEYDGRLPIAIRAVPEGSVIKGQQPQAAIMNTDPRFPWLTSYLETLVLRAFWYPSTVATNSRAVKKMMKEFFPEIDPNDLQFKLHDFGARGVSSAESAGIGGAAHLVNFMGTDTVEAVQYLNELYGRGDYGFSIPASEHSTMTIKGREGELDQMRRMLGQFNGQGKILACVSDSYNYYHAVEQFWLKDLKDEILASGGTVVIRPDSGDPKDVILWTLDKLWKGVGGTTNKNGRRVINPAFRVIQGDGVTLQTLREIFEAMVENNWALDNLAFGMGAGLLQKIDRDTYKYAMKACAVKYFTPNDGDHEMTNWIPVSKDPITDKGKKSKAGDMFSDSRLWAIDTLDSFQFIRARAAV